MKIELQKTISSGLGLLIGFLPIAGIILAVPKLEKVIAQVLVKKQETAKPKVTIRTKPGQEMENKEGGDYRNVSIKIEAQSDGNMAVEWSGETLKRLEGFNSAFNSAIEAFWWPALQVGRTLRLKGFDDVSPMIQWAEQVWMWWAMIGAVMTAVFSVDIIRRCQNRAHQLLWLGGFFVAPYVAASVYYQFRPEGDLWPCARCGRKKLIRLHPCPFCGAAS